MNEPDDGGNEVGDELEAASDGDPAATEPEDGPTKPGDTFGTECKGSDDEAAGETVDNDEPGHAIATGDCS